MKKLLRGYGETMVDLTLGGEVIKQAAVLPSGFREATQAGVAAGVANRTLKRNKLL